MEILISVKLRKNKSYFRFSYCRKSRLVALFTPVRGAKAKGSGNTRELELNEEKAEEEDDEDVVTRADLASEVVPLTS
jgi:hypothetical protein